MPDAGDRVLPVSADARVRDLLEHLGAALLGVGPALLPLPPDDDGAAAVRGAAALGDPLAPGTALLLATSGSTGEAKVVELGAPALLASADAAHARLGGPGQWLLALPLVHVAGWAVLVRSAAAGTAPVVLDRGGFDPAAFAAAAGRLHGPRRYTALVPTQLARVLADPAATRAAAGLDGVLVGGAATPPALLGAARAAGVRAVTTYGGTETAGGCVYDGVPLDGVRVALDDGRVALSGPVLARGYRGRPELTAAAFPERSGRRWHLSADLGRLRPGPGGVVLEVVGRADDVLVTGGEKVAPAAVEEVLAGLDGVAAALVVGVPDPEWGQAVVALVVPAPGRAAPSLEDVRSAVRSRLGAPSAPRHLLVLDALPALALGKPDRRAAAHLAARRLGAPG